MQIEPATLEQVRVGRTGRVHVVTAGESQAAADLQALAREAGTTFLLRYHEESEHWSVAQKYGPREDDMQLVATTQRADELPLVVTEIRHMVNRPEDYDLVGRLDRNEAARLKALDDEAGERAGDFAERAYSALRSNTSRIVVPRGVNL